MRKLSRAWKQWCGRLDLASTVSGLRALTSHEENDHCIQQLHVELPKNILNPHRLFKRQAHIHSPRHLLFYARPTLEICHRAKLIHRVGWPCHWVRTLVAFASLQLSSANLARSASGYKSRRLELEKSIYEGREADNCDQIGDWLSRDYVIF